MEILKSCLNCGACCANKNDSKWIEVSEKDADQLIPYILQKGDIQPYAMKQIHGKCCMLDGIIGQAVRCAICEHRPEICRIVQINSPICLDMRKKHGIE